MQADIDTFPGFPDEARLWIYTADRPVAETEGRRMLAALDPFLQSWTSHRRAVRGAAALLYGRFLVIAATAPDGDLSGCGIDKSVRHVESAGRAENVGWATALDIAWRDETGAVRVAPRPAFRQAVRQGGIDADTPVFDCTIQTVGALRAGRFERPAGESWHAGTFGIGQPAS